MREALMAAGLLLVAVAVIVALAWGFQRRLIYLPSGSPGDPADVGLAAAQPLILETSDGLDLGAWLVPAVDGQRPRGAVLVGNGNAGNRAGRARLAGALSQAGYTVLLFDYRGYGGNPGRPSETGLLRDARAARAALVDRTGLGDGRVAYFGESLGAAVVTALALEQPPAALLLRSPFASLAAVGGVHYPVLPLERLLWDRYPVVEHVAEYEGPLLVVVAENDSIVPAEQSRRVAEAAGGDARLVMLEGVGHNDPALLDGEPMVQAVVEFLRRHVG